MHMKKLLPVMLIIGLVQVFSGCEKEQVAPRINIGNPADAKALLSKVTYHQDTLWDTFEYNDKNEVIKVSTSSVHDTTPLRYSLYFYDDDSRLIKREFYPQSVDYQLGAYETFAWEGNEVTNHIYVVYYDGDNQKVSEELFKKHVYELNDKRETIKVTEFLNIPGLGLINQSYTNFTWVDGNITEKNTWYISDDGGQFHHRKRVTMEYDDRWNPYSILTHEVLTRSWQNNVINVVEVNDDSDDYITTYTYDYNALGYIASSLKKTVNADDASDIQEERFSYEYTLLE